MLPTAVEQLEPPPELRERLMQTVRAEAAAAGTASAAGCAGADTRTAGAGWAGCSRSRGRRSH